MLILAVFAVALLAVLAVGITAAVRVELLASKTGLDRTQGLFLAQAGMARARAILMYDDPTSDALTDPWGPLAEEPIDVPRQLGDGFYQVRVTDACGRIDINEANYQTLMRLTDDAQVTAAILDWRDKGSGVTAEGAEAEYYGALPLPYLPRDGKFQTPGELLLVRGVTPDLFFGTEERPGLRDLVTVTSLSANTDPEGNRKLHLDEFRNWSEPAFREQIVNQLGSLFVMYSPAEGLEQIFKGLVNLTDDGQPGYTSLAQLSTAAGLDFGTIANLVDHVTVDEGEMAQGKVNLNTAPLEVLALLPGSSETVASEIIARREQQPFTSLGEIVTLLTQLPDGPAVFQQMIDRVTTKSSCFLIESMGWTDLGHAHRTLSALVQRKPDMVLTVRHTESDFPLPAPTEDPVLVARR
ncbi:MAG: general secretion pathway protein GspK [Armatimonadetes bacterium]|nr:general secretion pathway protein GspK [Armatimonadota bacterium]